ncbi:endonuclease domain-containing protein [Candidatus Peregrinibacteria bacterium]|nr:endonuclease domain-containing protein [Candidatus Peregrinibacteria bacterium]MBI2524315.1 endonuclease domain-containing protein [Candidatus Peregrinibacteria bacterium]MBI4129374.1 endonuclease domain-containing protein [Candidatus Peregrinibacteria bacterium]
MLRNSVYSTHTPKTQFARGLRKDLTPGEKILWRKLRAKRFQGFKFRRQVPVGPYIIDFLCAERKLIIEIDGDSHYEPGAQERDAKREGYLRAQGFDILRFGNTQTVQELNMVIEKIGRVLGCFLD